VAYLAYLHGRFGNAAHTLAAYNMGPTALKRRLKNGNHSLGATAGYVKKIQARKKKFREGAQSERGAQKRKFQKERLASL
jgi:soluble lytic murein transglycosylase-like protein